MKSRLGQEVNGISYTVREHVSRQLLDAVRSEQGTLASSMNGVGCTIALSAL